MDGAVASPRPALEATRGEPSHGRAGIGSETRPGLLSAGGARAERQAASFADGTRMSFEEMAVEKTDYRLFLVSSPRPTPLAGPWSEGASPSGPAGVSPAGVSPAGVSPAGVYPPA